jgi:hypothetical protein
MGLPAFAAIVLVSVLAGIAVQIFGTRKSRYDAVVVAVTATFAAYFASETFPGSSPFATITNWGPAVDGFLVIPGIVFAVLITTVAYVGTRDLYASSPTTA